MSVTPFVPIAPLSTSAVRCVLAVTLLLCIAASAGAQVDDDTRPFTPFRITIPLDVQNGTGILNVTMPFDVKFIIWGDVRVGTTEVTLNIRRVMEDELSCKPGAGVQQQRVTAIPRKWTARDYETHDVMDSTSELANKETLQFEVLVNELSPNAYYCISFELLLKLTDAEAAALRLSLEPTFQTFLRGLTGKEPNSVLQQQLEPLRQAFLKTLLPAVPQRFTPVPGTMFDPNAKGVTKEFNDRTLEVFAEHGRVRDRLGNFESGGKERAPELIKWSQQIDALIKSKGLDPNVAAPFANLALEDARKILYGQQRTVAAAVPLEEFWDVDLNVVPPPGASYPLDAPCPVAGPAVNRCKLITEYREAVQALVKAAPGQTIADTAPVIAAFDNQRNQLLFAQSAVNARYRAMDSLLRSLDARIQESFSLLTTTGGSATTRKAWYISMDTGIAVAPALNEVFPYFGSTMFFRPVNKAVPPSTFGTRFSVLFGFTWTNNVLKTGEREALFGADTTMLLGAGFRVTEWLRFTGGSLVFKAVNPNPLLDETQLKITPFIAMSADIDVADVMKNLFGASAEPPDSGRVLADKGD